MKQTKTFRRIMSFLLIATMLLSMAVVGLVGVSAAEDALTLTYSFKYDNAGYAEGRVRLTASSTSDYDKYTLYWADDTKALEGYAPITTLNLNQESRSFAFGEFTAIPAGATKLIAVESARATGTVTVAGADAVYDIPESKQFKYTTADKEYTYQALSDIHIQHDDSYWVYSKQHWANALEVAAQRGAEFITVCGDAVNGYGKSNLDKEWPMYLQILADSSFTGPVFETNGNHEIKGNGGDLAQQADHDLFMIGSGLNVETDAMQSETYYEMTGPSGDHFIFMVLEKSGAPNEYSEFSDEQLDWLEGLLKKYYNDGNKIIINQHALTRNYGAGDDLETPYYKGGLLDSYEGEEHYDVQRFKALLEEYPNVIWFSGHSHIDFKYNYNINNMNGTTAYTVHIPSCSSTTHPNAGSYDPAVGAGSTSYIMSEDSSQGWLVDMYKDAVVLNGTDLVANKILPLYTYMIDYSGEELVENEVEEGEEDSFKSVVVTVDASALAAEAKSVKVSLYGADDDLLTKEITMTKDAADGLFKANVSTQFTKMKFIVNNGTAAIKTAEYSVADCVVKLGAYKITYNNDKGWSNVNVYVWNTAGGDAVAWPGMAMTKEADGTYIATVPDYPNMIIFNNKVGDSGEKTNDLDIAPYITEKISGSYTVNSTPTPPVEEDTTPTEPVDTITVYLNKPAEWENALIYGFYGVEGGTATGEPLGTYPGTKMTQVDGDVYSYEIPEDIDYIKFADGSTTNRRTNNFANSKFFDNAIFSLTSIGGGKWDGTAVAYTNAKSIASVGATASNYAIRGTFTDWGSNDAINFAQGSSTKIEATYELSAGEYKFKIYNMSTQVWYGNDGTIDGACENWGFRDGKGDATLNITGAGKYTITADVADSSRLGVTIAKAVELPVETDPVETQPVETQPVVTDPVETDPIETEPVATEPAETDPAETQEATTEAPAETVTVYFTNSQNWADAYIYGFYGVEGEKATGEPLGAYPGTKMTFVETNEMGQDIYSAEVPADIDYIKFVDNTEANNRTNNIPKDKIADNAGFYITDVISGTKWNYGTYTYEPVVPTETTASTGTTAPEVTTAPATGDEPTTAATEPAVSTVKVYFSNNKGWENVYIYGFYGVEGESATGEPLGTYPGTKMTFVSTNEMGQDIYVAEVPADIDYIKFVDGTAENNRTNNIPKDKIADNAGFYLTTASGTKWDYETYTYEPPVPPASDDEPTTATTADTTPTQTKPAVSTVKVYFSNNKGWENVYIYGFYGVEGETAEAIWPADYPGEQMTFVKTNEYGENIYSIDVPADIDYIKFSDGSAANNRTNNIPNSEITENAGFYLTDDLGNNKWGFGKYIYEDVTPTASENLPTETTAPTETEATQTKATEASATETKATEPVVTILCGDTDTDGKITVKDATTIQKVVADIAVLSYNADAADVDASGVVNVKDATMIQKYVADIIDKFPLEDVVNTTPTQPTTTETEPTTKETEPTTGPVTTTALGELLKSVKTTLANENYYASYVAYAGLKKAYFEYKDADIASMTEAEQNAAVAEINTALTAYNTMKKNNPNHVGSYQAPKPGSYLLRGTMNNWDESGVMSPDGDGVSITYTLAAGEHMLKVYDVNTGKWYGNGGTFEDNCSGWTMSDTAGDLKFTATGGTYKFTVKFVDSKVKLTVAKQ